MTIVLIIGNAVLALLCAVIFAKFSSVKKSLISELDELQQTNKDYIRDSENAQSQMRQNMTADNKKIESLLNEISTIRKEKEDEIKLRMEAEKQIVLAIQKAEDLQKRMQDWKFAQESAMIDSQNTIIKVGEDLYQKINSRYQEETRNSKQLFEQVSESIKKLSISTATITAELQSTPKLAFPPQQSTVNVENKIPQQTNKSPAATPPNIPTPKENTDLAKKLLNDLVKSMQESGHTAGQKYFLSDNFDAEKAKLFFCEAAFLQDSHCFIFDFKACNFLSDYTNSSDQKSALKSVTQKLDKYLAYLSNPKYRGAILKVLESKQIKFSSGDIISVVSSSAEIDVLEQIGYLSKLEDAGIKVATFDDLIDLTL